MNIAMLSFQLPAPGRKLCGTVRVAHDLANSLVRRGHDVIVWSADQAPGDALYRANNIPFARFVRSRLGFRLTCGYFGNLLALLPRYEGAHVLIAHGDSLLLPLLGIPVLRIMHGSAWDEARNAKRWPRRLAQFGVYLQELISARLQLCVGVSRNSQERNGAVRHVIPNGVDTRVFQAGSVRKSTEPSILFVGTLEGRKRGATLLKWFKDSVKEAIPEARLWMVSEQGPSATHVEYFPNITDADLVRLYQSAWVFACPSIYEGFGLPCLEAMAAGTPVVATSNPGSREVTAGGKFGVLTSTDEEFKAALIDLLQNSVSRARMAEEGVRRARDLSLDRTAEGYEKLLQKLAFGGRGAEAAA